MYFPSKTLQAKKNTEIHQFPYSCTDEVGALLRTLSATVLNGRIGEIGTGYGVGSSWILDALHPTSTFFSIDNDLQKVKFSAELLSSHPNAYFLHGDWKQLLQHGPFQLLFADGGKAKEHGGGELVSSLAIGGCIILDDLTPKEYWPDEWKGKRDPVREYWLNHPRIKAVEILVTPKNAVIIGTKICD